MKKVEGGQANPGLLAIIYGQPKMWKTSLALMAPPSLRPMAILDCDRGVHTRMRVLSMTPEEREKRGINVGPLHEGAGPWVAKDVDVFHPEFDPPRTSYYEDVITFAAENATDYKLVVVDTISTMAAEILNETKSTNYGAQRKRVTLKTGTVSTVHPTPSDYGMAQDRVLEFMKALDRAGCHVLLMAHEKTGQIEEAEVVKRVVAGPRTVGTAQIEVVPSLVDFALRLESQSRSIGGTLTQRIVVRTRNHGIYIAGDRSELFKDGEALDPTKLWKNIETFIGQGPRGGSE